MAAQTSIPIDVGIQDNDRKKIAAGLSRFLADTYTLYLKTHNFHWNVTGPGSSLIELSLENSAYVAGAGAPSERIRSAMRSVASHSSL